MSTALRKWVDETIWPRVYTARLKAPEIATLIDVPVDVWPGDATIGRRLIAGDLEVGGESIPLTPKVWSGLMFRHGALWHDRAHDFSWMRDLRAVGGDQARQVGRALLMGWVVQNRVWDRHSWAVGVTARRLYHWLAFYSFFMDSARTQDQQRFFSSLSRQLTHLRRLMPRQQMGLEGLLMARTMLAAVPALGLGGAVLSQAVTMMSGCAVHVLNNDGGVATRSPTDQALILRLLVDCRRLLKQQRRDVPEELEGWITNTAKALRFLRHADRGLGVFNGGQEGGPAMLDHIMRQSGVNIRKIPGQLPDTGYMRVEAGKLSVLFDAGYHDARAGHAGLLSFEMVDKNDRLIVNCGHHPMQPHWAPYMAMTAAHSTIGLDDCSHGHAACVDQALRKISEGQMMQASHTGYTGCRIIRKLFVQKQGQDVRGEDQIETGDTSHRATIRFHIHPDVGVLKQQGVITLRAKGGAGWRVTCDGADMTLEESLYLGLGAQRRSSQQIVLTAPCDAGMPKQVNWAICRL